MSKEIINELKNEIDKLSLKIEILQNINDIGDSKDTGIYSQKRNKQKAKKMKSKPTYKYDTHEVQEVHLGTKKSIKKAKEFLLANAEVAEDEILYVFKALKTSNGEVVTSGAYYGVEMSPLTFLINSKDHSENVFLAEATSSDALLEYLLSNRERDLDCNIYVLKVLYKELKLKKVESFYGGNHDLDFYIFDEHDEESNCYGEVLKRLGKVNYVPSLNYFMSKED